MQKSGVRGWLVAGLLLLAVTVAVADTWVQLVASSVPAFVDFGLLALSFVAVVGWLFVGKPARDTDAVIGLIAGAPPQSRGLDLVPFALAVLINRLHIDERHKDASVRVMAAAFFGMLLAAWHLQLLGLASK